MNQEKLSRWPSWLTQENICDKGIVTFVALAMLLCLAGIGTPLYDYLLKRPTVQQRTDCRDEAVVLGEGVSMKCEHPNHELEATTRDYRSEVLITCTCK